MVIKTKQCERCGEYCLRYGSMFKIYNKFMKKNWWLCKDCCKSYIEELETRLVKYVGED